MKKRILSTLLALCLVLAMLPAGIFAAEPTGTCGTNATWSYNEATKTLTISGSGEIQDFDSEEIPWASYQTTIQTLVIEKGITQIGSFAFANCTGLTSVTIPESVTVIRQNAFSGCTELKNITIPSTVTIMGDTEYGWTAFQDCENLNVTFAEGMETIPDSAFSNCTGLKSVRFPTSIKKIGKYAFNGTGLTSLEIPEGTEIIGDNAFGSCTELKSVKLPNSLKEIDKSFIGCTGLTSITIPKNLVKAEAAFSGCANLKEFQVDQKNPAYMGQEACLFSKDGAKLIAWPSAAGAVKVPETVTEIGDSAFWNCSSMTNVTLPTGLKKIGPSAFYDCDGLTDLVLPEGTIEIGNLAFFRCLNLQNVKFPESVTTIGTGSLKATKVSKFTIPGGVKYFKDEDIGYMLDLKTLVFQEGVEQIGDLGSFATTVYLPSTIKQIDAGTFKLPNCRTLTDIYYAGTEEQWKAVIIGAENDALQQATIHYDSGLEESKITVSTVSNGVVTVEHTAAAKGETVTITVKPNSGYKLSASPVVKDETGQAVAVTKKSDTEYTFVMPDSAVTISASFESNSTGGGSGSSGGGDDDSNSSGGSSATVPTKPSTPTQPTTPTKPTTPEQNKPEKPAVNASEKFTDVQAGAWYEQAVNYMLEKGLMNGTGDATFAPGDTLSRAMLAQILYNNEGKPAAKGESQFTDISGGWYADAVAWAAESGVVTGNADGSFNPNGPITREQIAVILYRYAQQKGYDTGKKADLSAFADGDSISDYAKEAMAWANAAGLINGMDESTLAPRGNATRAQVAAILMRFLESVK